MPQNWKTYKLSKIINLIGGGTPKTGKSEYWNGDIPWLSVVDFNNRPYSKSEVLSLDLNTMELDSIWNGGWFGSVQWSSDGKMLLLNGMRN